MNLSDKHRKSSESRIRGDNSYKGKSSANIPPFGRILRNKPVIQYFKEPLPDSDIDETLPWRGYQPKIRTGNDSITIETPDRTIQDSLQRGKEDESTKTPDPCPTGTYNNPYVVDDGSPQPADHSSPANHSSPAKRPENSNPPQAVEVPGSAKSPEISKPTQAVDVPRPDKRPKRSKPQAVDVPRPTKHPKRSNPPQPVDILQTANLQPVSNAQSSSPAVLSEPNEVLKRNLLAMNNWILAVNNWIISEGLEVGNQSNENE
ncbi:hypothetical protein CLIB1444_12S01266 [[Candida] jaroonii]|uniref:Uncharacterized protein n=1 Tax=[Candida] jaroonii TaxID=467808 RepID=A0ACA9YDH0_9ASCO|nr:hypothetical protein CLIB1444_12S01266 [[Candida] jaroonii]